MVCAINLILVHDWNWGYDGGMFTLHKGECEHCWRSYNYTLWQAGFGDFSYAYCDTCGMLGTCEYANCHLEDLPPLSEPHQEIDAEWEPFLAPCLCGGRFLKGASPRCMYCHEALSAQYAANHIERNSIGVGRGWSWQRNWSGLYCMALEDPKKPGTVRQTVNPMLATHDAESAKSPWRWAQILSLRR